MKTNRAEVGEKIAQKIRESIDEIIEIKYFEKKGNNGVIVEQIQVRKKDERVGVRIYIGDMIDKYQEGTVTLQEAGIYVLNQALQATDDKNAVQLNKIAEEMSCEKILSNVICQLLNYERNKEILERIPHTKWLDLAIVYRCNLDEISGSFLVTNEMLKQYDISLETLKQEAFENTSNENFKVKTMAEMMGLPGIGEDLIVATTEKDIYGAVVMTFTCVLDEISKQMDESDLYILPSSVHEVIIVKAEEFEKSKDLIDIVREVNASDAVLDTDILSDNIYKYTADDKCVTLLGK